METMTQREAKRLLLLLPVLQAAAEGKTIQVRNFQGTWVDRNDLLFAGDPNGYRVKPEPRALYEVRRPGSNNFWTRSSDKAFSEASLADARTRTGWENAKLVEYREVLPEEKV